MAPIDGLVEKTKSSIKIPNQCCQVASPVEGVAPSLGEVYRFPLCEGERVGMAALDVVSEHVLSKLAEIPSRHLTRFPGALSILPCSLSTIRTAAEAPSLCIRLTRTITCGG